MKTKYLLIYLILIPLTIYFATRYAILSKNESSSTGAATNASDYQKQQTVAAPSEVVGKLRDGQSITQEDLNKIIHDHILWNKSKHACGKKADLKGASLHDTVIGKNTSTNSCEPGSFPIPCAQAEGLSHIDLSQTNLSNITFNGLCLYKADFTNATFSNVVIAYSYLAHAIFTEAKTNDKNPANKFIRNTDGRFDLCIFCSDFSNAAFVNATINHAYISNTLFYKAILTKANLSRNELHHVNMANANMENVILTDAISDSLILKDTTITDIILSNSTLYNCIYEKTHGFPDLRSFYNVEGLETWTFTSSELSSSIIQLRAKLKSIGSKLNERRLTYAIENTSFNLHTKEFYDILNNRRRLKKLFRQLVPFPWVNAPQESNYWLTTNKYFCSIEYFGILLWNYCVGIPSGYGLYPARLFVTFFLEIIILSFVYLLGMFRANNAGLYKTWPADRIRVDLGSNCPERLNWTPPYFRNFFNAYKIALYFSLLSACRIGWHELNLGSWIVNLQSQEYVLKATGWMRTLSGIQSIISVYLLALWLMSYFGRLFE